MEERLPELIAMAVVGLVAMSMGLLLVRLRQPPIVGYILAGVVLGPTVLGFVPRAEAIPLIAELGVLLLLFMIGMEISLKAFLLDLRPSVITMLGQVAASLAVMSVFGLILGWRVEQIALLAFIVTMSSTAVAFKMLEDIGELRSDIGRIVVGVMIAQDIAIVPILILAKSFGGGGEIGLGVIAQVVLAVGLLVGFIAYLGRRGKIRFPMHAELEGRVELVTLTALTICMIAAVVSGIVGFSPIYGAFVAGLLIGATTLRSQAIHAMEPVQGVLLVLFFVAIGLLLDVDYLIANIGLVSVFVLAVLVLKSLANVVVLRFAGLSWSNAYQAGLVMGQIGEFGFVLAAVGVANGVLDDDGYRLAIAVIVLSLLFSPIWMSVVRRIHETAEEQIQGLREIAMAAAARGRGPVLGLLAGGRARARSGQLRDAGLDTVAPAEPGTAAAERTHAGAATPQDRKTGEPG